MSVPYINELDQIDYARAEVYALVYLTASVEGGIARVHPDIHGVYETWQAAESVRKTKVRPDEYRVCKGHWRKP